MLKMSQNGSEQILPEVPLHDNQCLSIRKTECSKQKPRLYVVFFDMSKML